MKKLKPFQYPRYRGSDYFINTYLNIAYGEFIKKVVSGDFDKK